MTNNERFRMALELAIANPGIDLDKLQAIATSDSIPTSAEETALHYNTPVTAEMSLFKNGYKSRRYSKQESDEVLALYREFDGEITNIPKNRIYGLANKQGRTFKALESRLYAMRTKR